MLRLGHIVGLCFVCCTQSNPTPPAGTLGRPCRPASTCEPGLLCHRDTCIQLQREPYDAEPVDGVIPPASLGGPIDVGPENTYIATFLTEEGFYVFFETYSVLFGRDGRELRHVENPPARRTTAVVFDGIHFYRFLLQFPFVLNSELEEVDVLDAAACRPEQRAVFAPSGRYLCYRNGPLSTFNLRTNEHLQATPEISRPSFRTLPGGTDELYVVQAWFELILVRTSDTGAPIVVGSRELTPDREFDPFWLRRPPALYQDGDAVIGHFGQRYDIASAQCLEDGDCFTQVTSRGERLYDFAAPGADGSVLFAPDHRGVRSGLDEREDPQPPCGRCRFERWAAGDVGERTSVEIGLPPFRYYLRTDTPRGAEPVLLDDPWEGGAWVLVQEEQGDDAAPFDFPRLELYRVPL